MKKLFLILLLLSPRAQAASDGCPAEDEEDEISMEIEISALYPNPNSGEQEWIELSNLGDETIDLSLYTLEDATAHPWGLTGTLEETARITGFSFQLNNSNETVTLKTVDGAAVDTWTYSSSTKGVALTRDSEATSETSTTTTTTSSVTTAATQTPAQWPIFSEALPNPEGSDSTEEWIELYNPYGETLNLSGLFLDDSEGGSSAYALSGSMGAESYLLISVVDSRITLNNDSDHVRLLGVNNEILWDVPYDGGGEGLSYAWFGSAYDWTEESTPGTENAWTEVTSGEADAEGSTSNYQDGDLSDDVNVTEVFPNPEGPDNEEEWIEITNGSTVAVNLGNWTLDDGEGGSDPFVFPDNTVLQPGETLILYRTETGIALNNSNETVQLADFTGEVMSEITYESSEEDQSYAEIQIEEVQSTQASTLGLGNQVFSTWQWVTPSPGALNPVWKQIKGEVLEFDGSLLTLFDGVSTWTFKLSSSESTDALLYETGNVLLVQAAAKNGLFEIMHSELVESTVEPAKKAFPWGILSVTLIALTYGSYEIYKRLQNKKTSLAI